MKAGFTPVKPHDKLVTGLPTVDDYHISYRVAICPHGKDVIEHKEKDNTPGFRCRYYWIETECKVCSGLKLNHKDMEE